MQNSNVVVLGHSNYGNGDGDRVERIKTQLTPYITTSLENTVFYGIDININQGDLTGLEPIKGTFREGLEKFPSKSVLAICSTLALGYDCLEDKKYNKYRDSYYQSLFNLMKEKLLDNGSILFSCELDKINFMKNGIKDCNFLLSSVRKFNPVDYCRTYWTSTFGEQGKTLYDFHFQKK